VSVPLIEREVEGAAPVAGVLRIALPRVYDSDAEIGLIQCQVVSIYRRTRPSIPGNKGNTDIPTATVVFESFASVTRIELSVEGIAISQIHGWQAHHELICQALELDALIYESLTTQKNKPTMGNGP